MSIHNLEENMWTWSQLRSYEALFGAPWIRSSYIPVNTYIQKDYGEWSWVLHSSTVSSGSRISYKPENMCTSSPPPYYIHRPKKPNTSNHETWRYCRNEMFCTGVWGTGGLAEGLTWSSAQSLSSSHRNYLWSSKKGGQPAQGLSAASWLRAALVAWSIRRKELLLQMRA